MSIAKPFTFVANTYAKASEVNANFDTVYSQVNSNISSIAQNATDIDNLENNKADINGNSAQRFAVANPVTNADAVNKQYLFNAIGNSIDYISGLHITRDIGSPEDTIIVSSGSCYDSTKSVVLNLSDSISKQNLNQGASTTYYVYIIGNSTGSSIDILISSNSTTPTLPSGYALYRQIGSYTTNSDGVINTILNTSLTNIINAGAHIVIDTYINGSSWYRVYSDKWCEQGGFASAGATVTLLKPYKDTNYTIVIGLNTTYYDWIQASGNAWYNKTTTSFVSGSAQHAGDKNWYTCGYIE